MESSLLNMNMNCDQSIGKQETNNKTIEGKYQCSQKEKQFVIAWMMKDPSSSMLSCACGEFNFSGFGSSTLYTKCVWNWFPFPFLCVTMQNLPSPAALAVGTCRSPRVAVL